eukprot:1156636-Pelagomonas_calceolata.AAC.22
MPTNSSQIPGSDALMIMLVCMHQSNTRSISGHGAAWACKRCTPPACIPSCPCAPPSASTHQHPFTQCPECIINLTVLPARETSAAICALHAPPAPALVTLPPGTWEKSSFPQMWPTSSLYS